MILSGREWRHLILVTMIIAALPVIIYPNLLGLEFSIGWFWYFILELIYSFLVLSVLNANKQRSFALAGALLALFGRLTLSAVFMLLLILMKSIELKVVFTEAFSGYKPALLLFSLTAPILYNSTISLIIGGSLQQQKTTPIRYSHRAQVIGLKTKSSSKISANTLAGSAERSEDHFSRNFASAINHVSSYSGVICCLLISSEGLPVAHSGCSVEDGETWAALALKLIAQSRETIARALPDKLERFEFRVGDRRFYMMPAIDMWLLSITDAAFDELEKIRVQQAAEMVVRYYNEKYRNIKTQDAEKQYAGNTI